MLPKILQILFLSLVLSSTIAEAFIVSVDNIHLEQTTEKDKEGESSESDKFEKEKLVQDKSMVSYADSENHLHAFSYLFAPSDEFEKTDIIPPEV